MRSRRLIIATLVATGLFAVTACAGDASGGTDSGPVALPQPTPTDTELVGQGTVLQKGHAEPMLCLGPIMESYPPQCSGPTISGWNWSLARYSETASTVTWGTYAVFGIWNGEAFAQTQPPIPLALYSPIGSPDPLREAENAGASDTATLQRISDEIAATQILATVPMNGYLWVSVTYDDGTIQHFFDQQYGPDVVIVQSALLPVG
ncbi:hypothetical protein [Cryobacterium sp. PH29-G1]|uniref:hypothetical protein n=1 Tax=Cryobacterium sp. PH29-G1 TaxID=3046211 RepID=UPI0024B98F49|nr:hypothetical protein [Cryobacterium sp. PH29-G1]MDJ0349706.1 hypothetical protein [Cryobacterium sp. PH29-G1]